MIFNKTVLNILSNFIPHEVIVCDDKDPPWFNGKIKSLFNEKLRTYNAYRKSSNNIQLRNTLRSFKQRLRDLNNRKIPVIPPLFHNNKFVTDFKEKTELFIFCNKK